MSSIPSTCCKDDVNEFTGEQLALESSERVKISLNNGGSILIGGRLRNGVQTFLNVPYALPVTRWTDPIPLPDDFKYEKKEYTVDGLYCAQPQREYSNLPVRQRCGLGKATECPFFADIYIPSKVNLNDKNLKYASLPVKVFIHGGFLQFGSTSGFNYNQQGYCTEIRNEVRVLLGHRVSVLGFLAAESPELNGNYGFKDVWVGLEWVKRNISAFGGNPDDIHLSGLSGGGRVVAEMIHQVAEISPSPSPFKTATLYSNAILTNPTNLLTAQMQFNALCTKLNIDNQSNLSSPDSTLESLRNVSQENLIEAVENLDKFSTFRGVFGNDGFIKREDMIEFQKSPEFSQKLKQAGLRAIVVGEVYEECKFYQQVHPAKSLDELIPNLARYYSRSVVEKLVTTYPRLSKDASGSEIDALFGKILADGQVHIPIRQLSRDLLSQGFPCIRFQSRYLTEFSKQNSPYVQHGTDLPLHHLRLPALTRTEAEIALGFVEEIDSQVKKVIEDDGKLPAVDEILCLKSNGKLEWIHDDWYDELMGKEAFIRE